MASSVVFFRSIVVVSGGLAGVLLLLGAGIGTYRIGNERLFWGVSQAFLRKVVRVEIGEY
jgi:hypothetical protein